MGAEHEIDSMTNLIITKLNFKSTRERNKVNYLSLELKAMCQMWTEEIER